MASFRLDHQFLFADEDGATRPLLPTVKRLRPGAAATFAAHALDALERAQGRAHLVNWPDVERAAARESLRDHQEPPTVLNALALHSPGLVDQAKREQVRAFVSQLAGRELKAPPKARVRDHGRDDDHGIER